MARVEAEELEGRETRLVFIAKNVAEAERVEDLLTEQGIDYSVGLEHYVSGILFSSERAGIGFHVLESQATTCRRLLRPRYRAGVVDEPSA